MNLPSAIYRYTADGIKKDVELCLSVLGRGNVSKVGIEACAANLKHAREAYQAIEHMNPYLGTVLKQAEQKLEEVQAMHKQLPTP